MYYAVYLGGPKWIKMIAGKNCGGKNCINQFEFEGVASFQSSKPAIVKRLAEYETPGFEAELREVERLIAEQGDQIDLQSLEERAHRKRPDDFFYKNGDTAAIGGGFVLE